MSNDSAPETSRKPVTRGRRPGTRTRLQEIQKQSSRQKILEAASKLFEEISYNATTIDEIVSRAGISRVTFYKHFDSKVEVAESINKESEIDFSKDYALLGSSSNPSEDEILHWMHHILDVFSRSRERIAMLAAMSWQDPILINSRADSYASIIRGWAVTIPGFRSAASGTDERARIRAHLLVVQLNELCYELGIGGWDVDHETALRVLAKQYREFIEEGA